MKNKGKYNEDVDIDIKTCSTTDCTGLIPSIPQSEAELQSYEELYHYRAKVEENN